MLVDVYAPEEVRLWLALGTDCGHLAPEECGDCEVGVAPGWWSESDEGFDEVLDLPYSVEGPWERWALEQGIAPGQPFMLVVPEPRVEETYCYDYACYEYDVYFDAEVVLVEPWPPERVRDAWLDAFEETYHKPRAAFLAR